MSKAQELLEVMEEFTKWGYFTVYGADDASKVKKWKFVQVAEIIKYKGDSKEWRIVFKYEDEAKVLSRAKRIQGKLDLDGQEKTIWTGDN